MHGRLKVKTTAQQQAEKERERVLKRDAYRDSMQQILDQRLFMLDKNEEPIMQPIEEHKPLLSLVAIILHANPDITVLWNIRKDAIRGARRRASQSDGDSSPRDVEDSFYQGELDLTRECLQLNPKSYGAWYHRLWCLHNMRNPDWKKEIQLCDRYLDVDPRNFHCWDHRFAVAGLADVSRKAELKFTTEMIEKNFSNYSAWHYRSKLLQTLFPGAGGDRLDEAKRREELDLVHNAAFTDPDDSSAWFFNTWLISKSTPEKPHLLGVVMRGHMMYIVLARYVVEPPRVTINGEPVPARSFRGVPEDYMYVVDNTLDRGEATVVVVGQGNNYSMTFDFIRKNGMFTMAFGGCPVRAFTSDPKTRELLRKEVEVCDELLTYEPNSKWTIYTKVLLLKAIGTEQHTLEIINGLDQLMSTDKNRAKYYQEQIAKTTLEYRLNEDKVLDSTRLDAANINLHRVYFHPYMWRLTHIDLSENQITSLEFMLSLLMCRALDLTNNMVCDADMLVDYREQLKELPLKVLILKGNEICGNEVQKQKLRELLPYTEELCLEPQFYPKFGGNNLYLY